MLLDPAPDCEDASDHSDHRAGSGGQIDGEDLRKGLGEFHNDLLECRGSIMALVNPASRQKYRGPVTCATGPLY